MQDIKQAWLSHKDVPDYLKEELKLMKDSELEYCFKNKLEFGTAGIRAKMNPGTGAMNVFTIKQATVAYAKFLLGKYKDKKIKIAIGHDNRFHGDAFSMTAAEVLSSYGIESYLPENNVLASTPFISQAIQRCNLDGGIIITASHNPKEDNGYKVYNDFGGQLLPEDTEIIAKNMNDIEDILNIDIKANKALIKYFDKKVTDDYVNDLLNNIPIHPELEKKVEFAYTPLHGTGSELMPVVFEKAGYKLHALESQMKNDPNFGATKSSNPEEETSFEGVIEFADKLKLNLILSTDPDADRLALVEKIKGKWYYYSGNEMGILYAYYLLNEKSIPKNAFIAKSMVSTKYVRLIANDKGVSLIDVPTGFKWVAKAIKDNEDKNYLFGFEESMGATFDSMTMDKDGHQAALLVADMANFYAHKKMSLKDVLKQIYSEYGNWFAKTENYKFEKTFDWKDKVLNVINHLKNPGFKIIAGRKIESISDKGVLTWFLEGGSTLMIRMSGTEPKLKIYADIFDDSAKRLTDNIFSELGKFIKGIK